MKIEVNAAAPVEVVEASEVDAPVAIVVIPNVTGLENYTRPNWRSSAYTFDQDLDNKVN